MNLVIENTAVLNKIFQSDRNIGLDFVEYFHEDVKLTSTTTSSLCVHHLNDSLRTGTCAVKVNYDVPFINNEKRVQLHRLDLSSSMKYLQFIICIYATAHAFTLNIAIKCTTFFRSVVPERRRLR